MIAPDETTFEYLKVVLCSKRRSMDKAVAYWKTLKTDADAKFDEEITLMHQT